MIELIEQSVPLWVAVALSLGWLVSATVWVLLQRRAARLLKEAEDDRAMEMSMRLDWKNIAMQSRQQMNDYITAMNEQFTKAKRLEGMVSSMRKELAQTKDERRLQALDYASEYAASDDSDVLARAKAYYRFLIGKS